MADKLANLGSGAMVGVRNQALMTTPGTSIPVGAHTSNARLS